MKQLNLYFKFILFSLIVGLILDLSLGIKGRELIWTRSFSIGINIIFASFYSILKSKFFFTLRKAHLSEKLKYSLAGIMSYTIVGIPLYLISTFFLSIVFLETEFTFEPIKISLGYFVMIITYAIIFEFYIELYDRISLTLEKNWPRLI